MGNALVKFPPATCKVDRGSLWLRGRIWWAQYYDSDGNRVRKSSESEDDGVAKKFLDGQLAKVDAGVHQSEKATKVKVGAIAKAYLLEYANQHKLPAGTNPDLKQRAEKLVDWTRRRWAAHLASFFGQKRAARITTEALSAYAAQRLDEGAAGPTVNRELALLRRMYRWALKITPPMVNRVPEFPTRLPESPARQGFITEEEFERLAGACPFPWLRALMTTAYRFGFRRSELLWLRVSQVDLENRTIRLEPGTTKNKQGRTVVMTSDVYALLSECVRGKGEADYVFTWQDGRPVRDFRSAWAKMAQAAGLPGLLLHDFRRSAIRNMIRRGVSATVAKKISGHLTDSVFQRYNITDERDLAEAALLIEHGHNAATIAD